MVFHRKGLLVGTLFNQKYRRVLAAINYIVVGVVVLARSNSQRDAIKNGLSKGLIVCSESLALILPSFDLLNASWLVVGVI